MCDIGAPEYRGRLMCILLVEDEPLLLMMTEVVLHDAGYEVMAAGHGPDALKRIAENPGRFIALVTDYSMPLGVTGTDIIDRIRQEFPLIPVILTSAYFNAVPPNWQHKETIKYLPKPYNPDSLVDMLSALL
jgi:CheY-like chemotaxis protein